MQVEWYSLNPGIEAHILNLIRLQTTLHHNTKKKNSKIAAGRREEKEKLQRRNNKFGKAYAVLLCCLPILSTSPAP
jgi:hypothetical protein